MSALASVFLAFIGLYLTFTQGIAHRFDPKIMEMVDAPTGIEHDTRVVNNFPETLNLIGSPNHTVDFVLIGDSHAKAASPAIHALARKHERTGFLYEQAGCFMSENYLRRAKTIRLEKCLERQKTIYDYIVDNTDIRTVFIAARWSTKTTSIADGLGLDIEDAFDIQKKELKTFVQIVLEKGKDVIIMSEVPAVGDHNRDIPSVLGRLAYYQKSLDLRPSVEDFNQQVQYADPLIEYVERETNIPTIWTRELFCHSDFCDIIDDNKSLYYDDDHLSIHGAKRLIPEFEQFF